MGTNTLELPKGFVVLEKSPQAGGGLASGFSDILANTLRYEGGYNPSDPSNAGIKQDTFNVYRKRQGLSPKPVQHISPQEVEGIYFDEFYKKPGFDQLPHNVSGVLFDYGVHSGPSRAVKALQKVVGAEQDGILGPKTKKAINSYIQKHGESAIVNGVLTERENFIDDITTTNPQLRKYRDGFMNRINDLRERYFKSDIDFSEFNPFHVKQAFAEEETTVLPEGFVVGPPPEALPEGFVIAPTEREIQQEPLPEGFVIEQSQETLSADDILNALATHDFSKIKKNKRDVAVEQGLLSGFAGIEGKDKEAEKEHPVASAISKGVGELAGLMIAGGPVGKGVGKLVQEGIKRYGIKAIPQIMTAARTLRAGGTFALKQTAEEGLKIARGEEPSASKIAGEAAFGAGLGIVGSIAKPVLRIPVEALYGFTTSKIQGASNIDAAVNGAVFGMFGLLNRADLSKEARIIAISEIKKNLSAKVQEFQGLSKNVADRAVDDFIFNSARKVTGETDFNKAFDKILTTKENNLKYFDELNEKIKALQAKPRISELAVEIPPLPKGFQVVSKVPKGEGQRIVNLSEEDVQLLGSLEDLISSAEGPMTVKSEEGEYSRLGTGFPDFFANKGYTKKEAIAIFDKVRIGEPLTNKQESIFYDLFNNFKQALQREPVIESLPSGFETEGLEIPKTEIVVPLPNEILANRKVPLTTQAVQFALQYRNKKDAAIKALQDKQAELKTIRDEINAIPPEQRTDAQDAVGYNIGQVSQFYREAIEALEGKIDPAKIERLQKLIVRTEAPAGGAKALIPPTKAISGAESLFGQVGAPIEPETLATGETPRFVKKSEIVKELWKKLGVPIRKGHFRRRQAVGIYKPDVDVIRWKKGGVATISHEVGHFLDDNYPELNSLIRFHKKELGPLDYDQKKKRPDEGFSEYLRFWVTNQDAGIKGAPAFHRAFMEWLDKNPQLKEILTQAKQDYLDYLRMPSVMKVKSQISFEKSEEGLNIGKFFNQLYDKSIDDLAPIERFVNLLKKKGVDVADENNPYILARLLRGWAGKANHFLLNKTFDVNLQVNGKGLKEILEPMKDNLDDLSTYLVARRAPELAKRKIETGVSVKDAIQAQKDLEGKYPKIREIAEELYKYQDRVVSYALKSGLIDGAQFVKMRELNKDYVPFFRVYEELQKGGHMGKQIADVVSPIKKIKGSERDIINPIESIIKNTYVFLQAAERNNVMRAMVTQAKRDPELGRMFERIPAPMAKVLTLDLSKEIKDKLGLLQGGMKGLIDKMFAELGIDPVVDIFRPSMFSPKEGIVTVLFGGKKAFFWTDPEIYKAVKGLDEEEAGILIKMLSYPAQWLRAGATTLSPEFLIRNPARDQLSAFIYSKYGYLPMTDFARGLFSLVKRDDLYWKWVRAGGLQSMLVSMDRNYLKKSAQELFGARLREKISPIEWLRALSEWMEQGTRLGEFIKGVEKGASLKSAAYASREVTLDFSRKGSKIKNLNRIIAFLNANIQGLNKPVRAFREAPGTTISRILLGITLPSILLYLLNRDDEQYKQLPQWQKDLFWIISIDSDDKELAPSGKILLRLPKPFEVGIVFGSLPERILEHIDREDPKLLNSLSDTILRGLSIGFIPTGLQPIIENMTNYSFFRQRRLESLGMERLLPEDRYSVFTHETTKHLGKLMGVSPVKMDNLIKGYTGSAGELALDTLDFIISGGKRKLPLTLENAPLLRGFVAREPIGSASEAVEKFYDNLDKATQAMGSIKDRQGKGEDTSGIRNKYPEYRAAPALAATARTLSAQRKQINFLLENEQLDDREKLRRIRTIGIEMTNRAEKANAVVGQIRKQSKE